MSDLKEQTHDFFQGLSFKFASRRYTKADSKYKPFELSHLANCYPHQFCKDTVFMRLLLKLLGDKEDSFQACKGFSYLGEAMPVKALWDKDLVMALYMMNNYDRDSSLYCSAVIYGCRNAISNGELTVAQFCRSPFAYKLIELAGREDRKQVYRAVQDLISSNAEAFVCEPWAHDFDFEASFRLETPSMFGDNQDFYTTFDLNDPNYRVDLMRLNSFFSEIDPTFQPVAIGL